MENDGRYDISNIQRFLEQLKDYEKKATITDKKVEDNDQTKNRLPSIKDKGGRNV